MPLTATPADSHPATRSKEPVPMMELRLSVRHHGDRAMIHIGGEIDLATCPQLQAVVVDLVDRGCHQLILDLQRVSFMDCAGIRGAGRCAAARPRARRFGEAGQAQTAGVAGAGVDWDDNGVPDRHLPWGGDNADRVAACCPIPEA
jgi:STAS domain